MAIVTTEDFARRLLNSARQAAAIRQGKQEAGRIVKRGGSPGDHERDAAGEKRPG